MLKQALSMCKTLGSIHSSPSNSNNHHNTGTQTCRWLSSRRPHNSIDTDAFCVCVRLGEQPWPLWPGAGLVGWWQAYASCAREPEFYPQINSESSRNDEQNQAESVGNNRSVHKWCWVRWIASWRKKQSYSHFVSSNEINFSKFLILKIWNWGHKSIKSKVEGYKVSKDFKIWHRVQNP